MCNVIDKSVEIEFVLWQTRTERNLTHNSDIIASGIDLHQQNFTKRKDI